MSNLMTLPSNYSSMLQAVPTELQAAVMDGFSAGFSDFGGSFRAISLRGFQFILKEGGSEQALLDPHMDVIILGMGPANHRVYYSQKYDGRTEGKPDAVWYENTPAPANVPAAALAKGSDGRYGVTIQRRIVVARSVVNQNTGEMGFDLNMPWVLDVGSMSLFGEDFPDMMAFGLAGLMRYCRRINVLPCNFVTRIIFNRKESVPNVRFIPAHDQNGALMPLPADFMPQVYAACASEDVKSLLRVTLIPDPNAPVQPQAAPQPAYAPQPAAAPAQPQPAPQAQPQPVYTPTPQPAYQPQPAPATQGEDLDDLMQSAMAASAAAQATIAQPQPAPQPIPQAAPQPQPATAGEALSDVLSAAGAYGE